MKDLTDARCIPKEGAKDTTLPDPEPLPLPKGKTQFPLRAGTHQAGPELQTGAIYISVLFVQPDVHQVLRTQNKTDKKAAIAPEREKINQCVWIWKGRDVKVYLSLSAGHGRQIQN